jgi:hypothetical protein
MFHAGFSAIGVSPIPEIPAPMISTSEYSAS